MLLDLRLNGPRIRADNLSHLLAVLVEQESRHGANAEFLRNIRGLIDIDLVELGLRVFLGVFDDRGCDGLAGPAPDGEAVEDHEGGFVGFEDLGLEFRAAADVSYSGLKRAGGRYVLFEIVDTHFVGGWSEVGRGDV